MTAEPKLLEMNAVIAIVNQVLREAGRSISVSGDSVLDELGLASIDFAEIALGLEQIVGREIEPAELLDVRTVADLGRAVKD